MISSCSLSCISRCAEGGVALLSLHLSGERRAVGERAANLTGALNRVLKRHEHHLLS